MGTEGGRGRLTFALPSLGDLGRGAFRVGVHVHEQGRHALSADLVRLDQALERVVHTQAHQRFELFVRVTARGLSDEEDQRRAQGSPRREADLPVDPQPVLVEGGNGLQRVVAPGVAVAGHVANAIEHAEHGSLLRAERALQLIEDRDGLAPEQPLHRLHLVVASGLCHNDDYSADSSSL